MKLFLAVLLGIALWLIVWLNIWYRRRRALMTEEQRRVEDEEIDRELSIW